MELMVSGFYSSEVLVNVGSGVTNGGKVLNDGGLYHAGPGSFSIASLKSEPTNCPAWPRLRAGRANAAPTWQVQRKQTGRPNSGAR